MDRLRRLLRRSGHSMVWALCCLMVMTVISAAVLVAGASAYRHALDDAVRQKAQLLTQSGIVYAVHMINSGNADWLPDGGSFMDGVITAEDRAIYFDKECEEPVYISYERRRDELCIISSVDVGNTMEKCGALFYCSESDGGYQWHFKGYTGL
ncbi:MAG: hypothetical protein IJZ95_02510 [Oscillospiraceae bacterium]|nr:hypothetical protein [Oscillospiraceae bacterium]